MSGRIDAHAAALHLTCMDAFALKERTGIAANLATVGAYVFAVVKVGLEVRTWKEQRRHPQVGSRR